MKGHKIERVETPAATAGAQLLLPSYSTVDLPEDLTRVTEEDAPALSELTGKQRALVQALARNDFSPARAHRNDLQGKVSLKYCYVASNLPKVSAAVDEVRAVIARRAIEANAWSYEESVAFAKRVLRYLERVLATQANPGTVFAVRNVVDVTRSMQFWKENLDKMHAFLVDKSVSTRIEVRELKVLTDDEVLELGAQLKQLLSSSRAVHADYILEPESSHGQQGQHANAMQTHSERNADALHPHMQTHSKGRNKRSKKTAQVEQPSAGAQPEAPSTVETTEST
jgi:hypothetical protein